MTWGATRCYGVRTVQSFGDLAVESDEPRPACVTLVDTFAPAAPHGLTGIASQGAISLIWEPSEESDLDGYLVLRGLPPGDQLTPITPTQLRCVRIAQEIEDCAKQNDWPKRPNPLCGWCDVLDCEHNRKKT